MLEKEIADVITFILIAGVGLELFLIIGLGIWRRLYLRRFTGLSIQTASQSLPESAHQGQSVNLRDTSAAPIHKMKSNNVRNQREK